MVKERSLEELYLSRPSAATQVVATALVIDAYRPQSADQRLGSPPEKKHVQWVSAAAKSRLSENSEYSIKTPQSPKNYCQHGS